MRAASWQWDQEGYSLCGGGWGARSFCFFKIGLACAGGGHDLYRLALLEDLIQNHALAEVSYICWEMFLFWVLDFFALLCELPQTVVCHFLCHCCQVEVLCSYCVCGDDSQTASDTEQLFRGR